MSKGKDVKAVLFRFCIFCLIIIGVLGFGYYFIASAQDNDQRVEIKIEDRPSGSGGDRMIIIKSDSGAIEPTQGAFIKTEDGKTVIIDAEKSGSVKFEKQMNKGEMKEFKSEMKMDKGGFSKGDMKGQEAKKGVGNKQDQVKGQPMPQMPDASLKMPPPPSGQPPAPNNEGVNLYINAMVNKNLFMPLGWVKGEQKATYVLTGVISNAENIDSSKAFIEQAGARKSFYASEGDTVGDTKVIEITEWGAKLDRSGEQIALKLGEGSRSGGEGFKGGGQPQRGGGDQKPGSEGRKDVQASAPSVQRGGGFDASRLPPFVKQMLEERGISIEELQNNPELQQKLRQEFMQRFQGGEGGGRRGGGDRPQVVPVPQ